MKSLLLGLLISSSLFAASESLVTGQLNGVDVSLKITQDSSQTQFIGNLGTQPTNLVVNTINEKSTFSGVINGRSVEMSLDNAEDLVTFEGQFNKSPVTMEIEKRDYAYWFAGEINGHRLSTHISKGNSEPVSVTGFYQRDLADLKILKSNALINFKGYINGNWANFTIDSGSNEYIVSGKLHGHVVNLKVTKSDFPLSNLLELILFNFYVPQLSLLSI